VKRFSAIITTLIIAISFILQAQSEGGQGIVIHQEPAIAKLVEKHKIISENFPKTDGYRVQIFSVSGVNSRNRAAQMKEEFLKKFPDDDVYIVYHSPSYKVRLGDFRTKLDALRYLQTIKAEYPFAFVVVDKIEFK
jgi:fatty acid-binding protein DegV